LAVGYTAPAPAPAPVSDGSQCPHKYRLILLVVFGALAGADSAGDLGRGVPRDGNNRRRMDPRVQLGGDLHRRSSIGGDLGL